eukprot:1873675-Heterocapsa_arctica.AAC.1
MLNNVGPEDPVQRYVSPVEQDALIEVFVSEGKSDCAGALAGTIAQKQFNFLIEVAKQHIADKKAGGG